MMASLGFQKAQSPEPLHSELLEHCWWRFLTDSCSSLHLGKEIGSSSLVADYWDFGQMDYLCWFGSMEGVQRVS